MPTAAKIDDIFKSCIKKNASDVHLLTGKPPVFRIDGELFIQEKFPTLDAELALELVFSVMSETQKKKFQEDREIDLSYDLQNLGRFRVNCYWERGNTAMAARLIPSAIPTMEELMLPQSVYKLAELRQGLVLVTGPTGSGKSTTLAAMINQINGERGANIITLEDPIEFLHYSKKSIITQRQLGNDMLSFPQSLKYIVRQDPNVILVGEMRDLETIATTISLAETGHLVLATLHTLSTAQTIDRIIDVFPPHQQNQVRLQLSMSLRGIVAQQLLPRVGGGRIAAREVLVNTPAIANLIRENKIPQIKTVLQTSLAEGMITMDRAIKDLLAQNLITRDIALSRASSKQMVE
ncbi:MAG TPA: type IV pilus twitching motility protein PilT [Patescibacteria group bacterium]|nr:type IV pilus twitching motility protein PilT [Patescibacteria group bacterium]